MKTLPAAFRCLWIDEPPLAVSLLVSPAEYSGAIGCSRWVL
jgi:hypothetical protein